jgi:hypothetical protein
MGSISREILGRVRESLRAVERMLHTEPVVLIDARGRHWMNSEAKKLLQRRGIREEEFLEWVRLGAVHLQRLSYQDLALHMLRLPGQEVVVLLREGCPPRGPRAAHNPQGAAGPEAAAEGAFQQGDSRGDGRKSRDHQLPPGQHISEAGLFQPPGGRLHRPEVRPGATVGEARRKLLRAPELEAFPWQENT